MNRQTFELLILGCSSASPTSDRHPSAQLLNIAERYFLIDCGEGTQMQLRRYRTRFQSIGHIFISHLHGDHFFGLPGLLSSMHLLGRKQPLTVYGPPSLHATMQAVFEASETRLHFDVTWRETRNDGMHLLFEDSKVEVHSFPLRHRIFCTGFLFREKPLPRKIDKSILNSLNISHADILSLKAGNDVVNNDGVLVRNGDATLDPPPPRSYAYCSDTNYFPEVARYVEGVTKLYHESTFLDEHSDRAEKTFHSTARQAASIARDARVSQLLLGHYSARYRLLEQFVQEAGEAFSDCELTSDGKKFIF